MNVSFKGADLDKRSGSSVFVVEWDYGIVQDVVHCTLSVCCYSRKPAKKLDSLGHCGRVNSLGGCLPILANVFVTPLATRGWMIFSLPFRGAGARPNQGYKRTPPWIRPPLRQDKSGRAIAAQQTKPHSTSS